jgi:spore coat polysaccharide biosynthesis predicted glycosyltransferase SpsG
MGTAFTILDSRVAGARVRRDRCRKSGRRSRVLIALGGGSYVFSIVRPLVEKIRRLCPDAAIVIAAGFSRSRPCPSVGAAQWIRRSNGLAGDFAACDVAVVAGGLTLYEACAVGAPAVGLAVVPAQQKAIAAFAASGALVDAGSWKEGEAALGRAAEGVASCLMDRSAADRRARRGRQLVDGRGARRVAARIRALVRCRRTQQVSHG